tara:strand:- start:200 stop:703 length:504 start_codon:yes stop_codon:yes gene_type:complete
MNNIDIISAIIAGPRDFKLLINAFHSLTSAPATIIINNNVEILLANRVNELANVLYFVLTYKPIQTGTAVMMNIVNPKERILIGGASDPIKYSIENPTINGNVITVAILTIAVYEIDKAVSPFTSLVIILEVTPPGQQARIIIPTAISFGKTIRDTIINETKGSMII